MVHQVCTNGELTPHLPLFLVALVKYCHRHFLSFDIVRELQILRYRYRECAYSISGYLEVGCCNSHRVDPQPECAGVVGFSVRV